MTHHAGPIRWGIAATGNIAAQFATAFPNTLENRALENRALENRARAETASIVAVASRRDETARAFANAHGIERAHGTYAALAADPDVDIVYVASLQPGHVTDAIRFVEAGKHVLVEKPMTLSVGELDRVIAAARANDRFAMEAMWMRFNPAPVAAVEAVRSGAIGELTRLDIDFTIAVDDDPDHRLRSLEKGGGSLLDLGIYPITLAWWLLGAPTSWTVDGDVAGGVDTRVVIEAVWPTATATLACGLNEAGPITAQLRGSAGELTVPMPFFGSAQTIVGDTTTDHLPASLHWQVDEVHRCLRAGERESPRNPLATTRAILSWCDEIRDRLGVRYPSERS